MMPVQRVRDAENRMRNKLSNGPLRVQSNAIKCKVFCNVRHTLSCRGIYVLRSIYVASILMSLSILRILQSAWHSICRESRWHRESLMFSSLTEYSIL